MRLGGPVQHFKSPDEWVKALQDAGYRAAYCPVSIDADLSTIQAYASAAQAADIVIAEVGAWHNNPISPDNAVRAVGIENCQRALALADEIGARCCVNVSGSHGARWDGAHPDNLTQATLDLIIETVRLIIDAVKPKRTFFTLETMPWSYPDSVNSYSYLLKAVDRRAFAVHFDPTNLIRSIDLYYANGRMIEDAFKRLGAWMKSCHAKDVLLQPHLTMNMIEVRPGTGVLDYPTLLRCMDRLDLDTPLMLEHLPSDEYPAAASHIRGIAQSLDIKL